MSILFIIMASIALPLGGIQMQKMWSNQLGDIYSLGLGSAACLGGALSAILGIHPSIGAFFLCFLCSVFSYVSCRLLSTSNLITFGMLNGSVIGALGTIVANNASPENLQIYYRWAGASFCLEDVPVFILALSFMFFVVGLYFSIQFIKGVSLSQSFYTFNVSIFISAIISVCGIIGLISLIIPNIIRAFKPDLSLIKGSVLSIFLSFLLLIITYLVTIVFNSGFYLPVSATLSLLSAPLMIVLFYNQK